MASEVSAVGCCRRPGSLGVTSAPCYAPWPPPPPLAALGLPSRPSCPNVQTGAGSAPRLRLTVFLSVIVNFAALEERFSTVRIVDSHQMALRHVATSVYDMRPSMFVSVVSRFNFRIQFSVSIEWISTTSCSGTSRRHTGQLSLPISSQLPMQ